MQRVIQRYRDAGRTQVSPLVHDPVGFAHRLAQILHHELDGAQVELCEDVEVDLIHRQPCLAHHRPDQRRPIVTVKGRRELAHKLHARFAQLVHHLGCGRLVGAPGVDAQRIVILARGEQLPTEKSGLLPRADDNRSCAIGKQRAGILVAPIDILGHAIAASDQDIPVGGVGGDVARRHIQGRDPSSAGAVDIECPRVSGSQLGLHGRGSSRTQIVGCVGGNYDQV